MGVKRKRCFISLPCHVLSVLQILHLRIISQNQICFGVDQLGLELKIWKIWSKFEPLNSSYKQYYISQHLNLVFRFQFITLKNYICVFYYIIVFANFHTTKPLKSTELVTKRIELLVILCPFTFNYLGFLLSNCIAMLHLQNPLVAAINCWCKDH